MWRYGFSTPPNYNDHELYCGGYTRQWQTNGGKCGICGDPWDSPQPRANEAGGMYGKGVIARKYERNQVIKVRVELTANHMGYFEFRMCPNNNAKKSASQICLDQYILQQAKEGDERFYPGSESRVFEMHYRLPKDLTCRQCVFQWRYIAGNNWGVCKNGTGAVGCGPQEEFRACADVTITESDGTADDVPNSLSDPEIYIHSEVDDDYNEIDGGETTWNEYETLEDDLRLESILLVVLASMLFTVIFFGVLFFYYTRGQFYFQKYVKDKEWDMPSMPKMPKMAAVQWPLSNVQIKNLPTFLHKNSKSSTHSKGNEVKKSVSAPINVLSSTNKAAPPTMTIVGQTPLPRPPPRSKRVAPSPTYGAASPPRVESSSPQKHAAPQPPRLATITARPHPVTRPSAPPPTAPSQTPVLEIGPPTAVTINGVSFATAHSEDDFEDASITTDEDVYSRDQGLVPAHPAMADEDIPDSMEQHVPPPLPNCPPPEEFDIPLDDGEPLRPGSSSEV
eukprot:maker-scaffold217_size252476-snap-gene-1.37 protein:Tk00468 transcript:maker-scaffold217_size252476-snap-gene-1.37-mRNA-1 annotation:"conserved hypothetical protein"